MTSATTKNPKSKPFLKFLLIILPVLLLVWLGYSIYGFYTTNYARDIAHPIETALVQAGAVRKCVQDNIGRDPSSTSISYKAIYEIKVSIDETKQIIKDALTTDNQLSIADFGHDEQYQEWTIRASKPSPYDKLQTGQAAVGAVVYERRHFDPMVDKLACTLGGEGSLPNTTTFSIGVNLPIYK